MFSRRNLRKPSVSALFALAATLGAVLQAGCSDRMLDAGPVNYVVGGGPPRDAATPIRAMSGETRPYPNLGTVPPRPTDVPTAAQTQSDMDRLAKARSENRAAGEALKAIPGGPEPLAVPPPPRLTTPAAR